jgi:hypothetical protein
MALAGAIRATTVATAKATSPVPAAQAPPPTRTPPTPASQPRARQGPRPPPPVPGMVTEHRQHDPQHQQPSQLGTDDRRGRGDRHHHHPGRDQHPCQKLPPREAPRTTQVRLGWFAGSAARPRPPRHHQAEARQRRATAATTAPACSPQTPASPPANAGSRPRRAKVRQASANTTWEMVPASIPTAAVAARSTHGRRSATTPPVPRSGAAPPASHPAGRPSAARLGWHPRSAAGVAPA